jgi:hypothetical protein
LMVMLATEKHWLATPGAHAQRAVPGRSDGGPRTLQATGKLPANFWVKVTLAL